MAEIYKRLRIGNDILAEITISSGTHNLDEVNWECLFYTDGKNIVKILKSDSYRVDSNHYIVPVSTSEFNEGILQAYLQVELPNAYFKDGFKTEIVDINIEKMWLFK